MTDRISWWPTFAFWVSRKTGFHLPIRGGDLEMLPGHRLRRMTDDESRRFRADARATREAYDRARTATGDTERGPASDGWSGGPS